MRIVVTGSSGVLGRPTANYGRDMGADTLGVDLNRRPGANDLSRFMNADLTTRRHG